MMWWLSLLLNKLRNIVMTRFSSLAAVRKRHFMLEALPDAIVIPALHGRRSDEGVKPITEASLDDVAFALRGVEAEFSAVGDRLHALKKLYQLARDAGALGADIAVEIVAASKGKA